MQDKRNIKFYPEPNLYNGNKGIIIENSGKVDVTWLQAPSADLKLDKKSWEDTAINIIKFNIIDSKLLDNIKETLSNIEINKDDFERKKKVLISNELFLYDNIEVVNEMIIDNILFDNKLIDNIIPIIKELNYEELCSVIDSLNLDNNTIVILK